MLVTTSLPTTYHSIVHYQALRGVGLPFQTFKVFYLNEFDSFCFICLTIVFMLFLTPALVFIMICIQVSTDLGLELTKERTGRCILFIRLRFVWSSTKVHWRYRRQSTWESFYVSISWVRFWRFQRDLYIWNYSAVGGSTCITPAHALNYCKIFIVLDLSDDGKRANHWGSYTHRIGTSSRILEFRICLEYLVVVIRSSISFGDD